MASIYTVVIAVIVLFGLYAAFIASMCLAKALFAQNTVVKGIYTR